MLASTNFRDPFKLHADCVPQPILGPCIMVAGQALRWEGGNYELQHDVAIITRVLFETYAGKVTTTTLDIENLGTSTIYFSWTVSRNIYELYNIKDLDYYICNIKFDHCYIIKLLLIESTK